MLMSDAPCFAAFAAKGQYPPVTLTRLSIDSILATAARPPARSRIPAETRHTPTASSNSAFSTPTYLQGASGALRDTQLSATAKSDRSYASLRPHATGLQQRGPASGILHRAAAQTSISDPGNGESEI